MLTLATHWQSGSSVAQWLPTLANSWLLKSQFAKVVEVWREWRGENPMGYVVGSSVSIGNTLAEW